MNRKQSRPNSELPRKGNFYLDDAHELIRQANEEPNRVKAECLLAKAGGKIVEAGEVEGESKRIAAAKAGWAHAKTLLKGS